MPHNSRAQASWSNGDVPTGADFETFDLNQYKSVNGDDGGTWAPASAITIGGAGIAALGRIRTIVAGDVQLAAGAADFPTFTDAAGAASVRSRVVVQAVSPFALSTGWTIDPAGTLTGPATTQSIGMPINTPHDGATLFSATLYFKVYSNHGGAVPASMPQFQVGRTSLVTGVTTALKVGYAQVPTPADGYDWYSAGVIQSLTLTTTQNNVVDRSLYAYQVTLLDESGANAVAGNLFYGFSFTYTSIADMRFP